MRRGVQVWIAACAVATAGSMASAGDLNPPGAPAPTMKTLNEVEARIPVGPLTTPGDATALYVISQPGSYYLSGSITGVSGMNGIRIDASNVALDLNGFTIQGVPGALSGIFTSYFQILVAVRNGLVANWPANGVSGGMDGGILSDLQITGCGQWGVNVGGSFATLIERVVVYNCGNSSGLGGGIGSTEGVIRDCTVRSCATTGIEAGQSLVSGCFVGAITSESGIPAIGIYATMVDSCRVVGSAGVGIWGTHMVRGCSSQNNVGANYTTPNLVESY